MLHSVWAAMNSANWVYDFFLWVLVIHGYLWVTNLLMNFQNLNMFKLSHIGRAVGYCNQGFLCVCTCMCVPSISGWLTTLALQSSYQQTYNYTRKDLKPFDYIFMTIIIAQDCHFTIPLVAKEFMETQLVLFPE